MLSKEVALLLTYMYILSISNNLFLTAHTGYSVTNTQLPFYTLLAEIPGVTRD
jgi:hypothetical protein